jgi:hypothetical protein
MAYVADEVIVDEEDRELIDELVGRYGAEVIDDRNSPSHRMAFGFAKRGLARAGRRTGEVSRGARGRRTGRTAGTGGRGYR